MPPDVERYLTTLVATAERIVHPVLLGAYAAGSLALDAFLPGRSDIDVALVTTDNLDQGTRHALVDALRHESVPVPARGLELVVYPVAAARSGTTAPAFDVELNTGPRMEFRATYGGDQRDPADGLFWYALDRSILREAGRPLIGPPTASVFGPVAEDDIRALLVASVRWWMALPVPDGPAPGTDDAVLGACRALARVHTGRWLSKRAAGELIAGQSDTSDDADRELIGRSIAARSGGTPPSGREARRFQHRALAVLEHAR